MGVDMEDRRLRFDVCGRSRQQAANRRAVVKPKAKAFDHMAAEILGRHIHHSSRASLMPRSDLSLSTEMAMACPGST
ncbi:hypothetical protein GCM10023067_51130 [Aminobacter aganoensis]